jgi:NADH:ubiquinone oxidoreductase subunit F (NADH-binding)
MTDSVTRQTMTAFEGAPAGLPRLLLGSIANYSEHTARFGPLPDLHKRAARALFLDSVDFSALRGRGGAGFPTGRKLRAVADGGRGAIVVANGAEGEPASWKDTALLTIAPHLVIDGAVVAAHAVRAKDIYLVVDRGNAPAVDAVAAAIAEREAVDREAVTITVVYLPGRYVAGEESAVVNFINGGPAKPTTVPPRPFERGVRGRPTLVQNVETLANLALIARFGADWYRSIGTPNEPGSILVTLNGAITTPGVYEFALGTPLGDVLDVAGGTTEPISAVLVGGYFGSWIATADVGDLPLTHDALRHAGGALGCGVIAPLPARRCGVTETARIVRYLAQETAGQCGPCLYGLGAIAEGVDAIAARHATKTVHKDVVRWLDDVANRGACHHPDAAVGFLRSALKVFADEFAIHERHARCSAPDPSPILPLPDPATRDWEWR